MASQIASETKKRSGRRGWQIKLTKRLIELELGLATIWLGIWRKKSRKEDNCESTYS